MATQKTLDDLLVEEDDLNEGLLTEVLAPYVRIGKNSGDFAPTPDFEELQAIEKTAVVLLYRKAAFELGFAEKEGATPTEITEVSGINNSTVRGAVRKLDEMNLVQKEDSMYTIPTYNYESVKRFIRDVEDER